MRPIRALFLGLVCVVAWTSLATSTANGQTNPGTQESRSRPVFDNWNTAACAMTDTAEFRLDQPVRTDQIQVWYRWRAREASVAFTLSRQDQILHHGTLTRGNCDPYQEEWCIAANRLDLWLPPGFYRLRTAQPRVCQNPTSHGNGFVKVQATVERTDASTGQRSVALPSPPPLLIQVPAPASPAPQVAAARLGEGSTTAAEALAGLEQALRAGSVESAVKLIHPVTRGKYQQLFGAHPADLTRVATALASRVARKTTTQGAEYAIVENGRSFTVVLRKRGDRWFVYDL